MRFAADSWDLIRVLGTILCGISKIFLNSGYFFELMLVLDV
jgi:hypothetical protein